MDPEKNPEPSDQERSLSTYWVPNFAPYERRRDFDPVLIEPISMPPSPPPPRPLPPSAPAFHVMPHHIPKPLHRLDRSTYVALPKYRPDSTAPKLFPGNTPSGGSQNMTASSAGDMTTSAMPSSNASSYLYLPGLSPSLISTQSAAPPVAWSVQQQAPRQFSGQENREGSQCLMSNPPLVTNESPELEAVTSSSSQESSPDYCHIDPIATQPPPNVPFTTTTSSLTVPSNDSSHFIASPASTTSQMVLLPSLHGFRQQRSRLLPSLALHDRHFRKIPRFPPYKSRHAKVSQYVSSVNQGTCNYTESNGEKSVICSSSTTAGCFTTTTTSMMVNANNDSLCIGSPASTSLQMGQQLSPHQSKMQLTNSQHLIPPPAPHSYQYSPLCSLSASNGLVDTLPAQPTPGNEAKPQPGLDLLSDVSLPVSRGSSRGSSNETAMCLTQAPYICPIPRDPDSTITTSTAAQVDNANMPPEGLEYTTMNTAVAMDDLRSCPEGPLQNQYMLMLPSEKSIKFTKGLAEDRQAFSSMNKLSRHQHLFHSSNFSEVPTGVHVMELSLDSPPSSFSISGTAPITSEATSQFSITPTISLNGPIPSMADMAWVESPSTSCNQPCPPVCQSGNKNLPTYNSEDCEKDNDVSNESEPDFSLGKRQRNLLDRDWQPPTEQKSAIQKSPHGQRELVLTCQDSSSSGYGQPAAPEPPKTKATATIIAASLRRTAPQYLYQSPPAVPDSSNAEPDHEQDKCPSSNADPEQDKFQDNFRTKKRTRINYKHHMRQLPYMCIYCLSLFDSEMELQTHRRSHRIDHFP